MFRICMVLNNFEPPYGGPELQATKIAKLLQSRGHSIFFIAKGSGKAPDFEIVEDIPIYRLNCKGFASWQILYTLWKLKDQFDIIHVHGVGRLASSSIWFAKKFDKKVFVKVTTAGHILKNYPRGLKGTIKKLSPFRHRKVEVLKKADGMIAISDEIFAELIQYRFLQDKIHRIPNGVDTSVFHPILEEERLLLRDKLGLPKDKKVFIFTGKLTKRKGMDILLQAWEKAKKKQAMLFIAGSGSGQSDSLEEWARNFVVERSLNDSVFFLGAISNVSEYLQASDIFLFPSRREGLSNSLLEAMACGLICIGSDIGGNRDLLKNNRTGYLASHCIADWILQIEEGCQKINSEISKQAVNEIVSNYSIISTVDKLEIMYDSN